MVGKAKLLDLAEFAAALPGSRFELINSFIDAAQATRCYQRLIEQLPWQQHKVRLFGREHLAPRLSCWIGDPNAHYRYSGVLYPPGPWTGDLAPLRKKIESFAGAGFNSVLANWYRDGNDCMGWHSDDETELGPEPLIASLSLGGARRFQLRSRDRRWRCQLELQSGSLLLMAGSSQRLSQHALARAAGAKRASTPGRLNLTFRQIIRSARAAAGSQSIGLKTVAGRR